MDIRRPSTYITFFSCRFRGRSPSPHRLFFHTLRRTDHDLSDLSTVDDLVPSPAVVRGCAGAALQGKPNPQDACATNKQQITHIVVPVPPGNTSKLVYVRTMYTKHREYTHLPWNISEIVWAWEPIIHLRPRCDVLISTPTMLNVISFFFAGAGGPKLARDGKRYRRSHAQILGPRRIG